MPRKMSFFLTTEQVRNHTKRVTRRNGWKKLRPGDIVTACVKCMGIPKGSKVEVICDIRIVSNRKEPLRALLDDPIYGFEEMTLEGFPRGHEKHEPAVFCEMFIANMGGDLDTPRNRIEFEYV